MAKVAVMIANDIIADGESRPGGKLAVLEQDTATVLMSRGACRPATDDERAAAGVVLEAPAPAPALRAPRTVKAAEA